MDGVCQSRTVLAALRGELLKQYYTLVGERQTDVVVRRVLVRFTVYFVYTYK